MSGYKLIKVYASYVYNVNAELYFFSVHKS